MDYVIRLAGTGFGFWDETNSHFIGPFANEVVAAEAKHYYFESLNAETEAEARELLDEVDYLMYCV